jgi:uncharacterized protein (DUF924 family)
MDCWHSVLDFWFGSPRGPRRREWFVKSALFDEAIRARFLPLVNAAAQGRLDSWRETPDGSLALLVLTDQFPRNLFRGSGRAFETDPIALSVAAHILEHRWDAAMKPVERLFVYLPYEHSEVLQTQERSLELFRSLAAFPETPDAVDYSRRHWEIVKRFGRFPHRNAALGRVSTPEEVDFLRQPGSGF